MSSTEFPGHTRLVVHEKSKPLPRQGRLASSPALQSDDQYIKVEWMVCLLDRSDLEAGRDYCAADGIARGEQKGSVLTN